MCLWFLIRHNRVSQFGHVIVPPQETREMDKETVIKGEMKKRVQSRDFTDTQRQWHC